MADDLAREIGEALRGLWNEAGRTLSGEGWRGLSAPIDVGARSGELGESLGRGLRSLVSSAQTAAELQFSDDLAFEAWKIDQYRQFFSGLTGQEIEFPESGSSTKIPTPKESAEAAASVNLLQYLNAAERRTYDMLKANEGEAVAQSWLAGKRSVLLQRAAFETRDREGLADDLNLTTEEQMRLRQERMQDSFAGALSFEDLLGGLFDSLGAGGGGGGQVGPTYTAPDQNAVKDQIKLMMVGLLGRTDETLLAELVAEFMTADQARFNGSSTDPAQLIRDRIRGTERYKTVHKLRPESIDEADWLPMYRQVLVAAGMPMSTIDKLAAEFAMSGSNPSTFTETGFGIRLEAEQGVSPQLTEDGSRVGAALGRLIR